MSDFPGEMTKQSFVAPPRIMRSTRYSLTARGCSPSASTRLPTGSSSLEKASGWMRVPAPAAGMMPHMSRFSAGRDDGRRVGVMRVGDQPLEFLHAMGGGVFGEHAFPGLPGDAAEF